jgi:DNA-binding Lrp family transcriptional regulator
MSEDKAKIAENLFDPDISVIMAELEGGEMESSVLSEKLGISEDEIKTRLTYLIETGFVTVSGPPPKYGADSEKISKFMENDENYKGVVDGLTELDSYLN